MSLEAVWQLSDRDPEYPEVLRSLADPPETIYGIGDATLLAPGLAIVGSRRATPYGIACSERFAAVAATMGIVTVSGGARGCDAAAHRGALDSGGATVAVLGCGPDVDYPPTESILLGRIRRHGCVISELPPGHQPRRWTFPRRNRIIAGLARCVLVVEAGLPSGTFSTADHALDAGRDVLAVPGSIFAAGSAGTNRLIRSGAQAITCDDDLFDALGYTFHPLASRTTPSSGSWMIDPGDATSRAVIESIAARPAFVDGLADDLGLSVSIAAQHVTRLEIDGLVCRYPDGTYGVSRRLIDGDL